MSQEQHVLCNCPMNKNGTCARGEDRCFMSRSNARHELFKSDLRQLLAAWEREEKASAEAKTPIESFEILASGMAQMVNLLKVKVGG